MYYLIRHIEENDYNYLFLENGSKVTYSIGEWKSSIEQALSNLPKYSSGNWDTISQLKSGSDFEFLCSSPNPITSNSHPELFI